MQRTASDKTEKHGINFDLGYEELPEKRYFSTNRFYEKDLTPYMPVYSPSNPVHRRSLAV